MRRAWVIGALFAACAAPASGAAPAPERLLVTADEWSLVLSRQSVTRGSAVIELRNMGEDAHDLRLRRRGRARVIALAETPAGGLSRGEARLRRGRYVLWCSLPGHARDGMRATLRVRR